MDLFTQQIIAQRQRKLADMLRLNAENNASYIPPQGQMVSGRYVPPAWSQNLSSAVAPMAEQQRAKRAEQLALMQELAAQQNTDAAQRQWLQSAPAAIPGHAELQGPQAEFGSPELAAGPAQLPTRDAVLRHTLAGLRIPGNEKAAALWNQGMQEEQVREDKQADARLLQQTRLEEARAVKEMQLRAEALRLKEKIEQQERENVRDNETRRQYQALLLQIAKLKAGTSITIAGMKAGETGGMSEKDITKDVKALMKDNKSLNTLVGAAQQVQSLIDANTDPATGKTGNIPGIGHIQLLHPLAISLGAKAGLVDPNSNNNAALVDRVLNDLIRQNAGLSQTISEQARQLKANLAGGNYSQAEFVKNWTQLVRSINDDMVNIRAGYDPEVIDRFVQQGGKLDPIVAKPSGKTKVLTKVDKVSRLEELRAKQAAGN